MSSRKHNDIVVLNNYAVFSKQAQSTEIISASRLLLLRCDSNVPKCPEVHAELIIPQITERFYPNTCNFL